MYYPVRFACRNMCRAANVRKLRLFAITLHMGRPAKYATSCMSPKQRKVCKLYLLL